MEEAQVGALLSPLTPTDEATTVLKAQVVEAIVARLERGEAVKRLAVEYGVDPKTIRGWRDRGAYRSRAPRAHASILDPHREWLHARAPELEYNSAVPYRELKERGYTGCSQQVLRFVRPLRVAARQRATVRFETEPGRQAQVDFGQRQVWIADRPAIAHVFVFTLGYSRRCYVEAFRHERLEAVLAGREHAFHHFAHQALEHIAGPTRFVARAELALACEPIQEALQPRQVIRQSLDARRCCGPLGQHRGRDRVLVHIKAEIDD